MIRFIGKNKSEISIFTIQRNGSLAERKGPTSEFRVAVLVKYRTKMVKIKIQLNALLIMFSEP